MAVVEQKNYAKMKNLKVKWLPLLLFATLVFVVTACNEKNETQNESLVNSIIVGTWRQDFSGGFEILTFKKDGTGTWQEYDSEKGGIQYTESFIYYYDKSTEQYKIIERDEKNNTHIITVMYVNETEMVIIDPDGRAQTFFRVK